MAGHCENAPVALLVHREIAVSAGGEVIPAGSVIGQRSAVVRVGDGRLHTLPILGETNNLAVPIKEQRGSQCTLVVENQRETAGGAVGCCIVDLHGVALGWIRECE